MAKTTEYLILESKSAYAQQHALRYISPVDGGTKKKTYHLFYCILYDIPNFCRTVLVKKLDTVSTCCG